MKAVSQIPTPISLFSQYVERQQLTKDHLQSARMTLVTTAEASILGAEDWICPAVAIPYFTPSGELNNFIRYRLLVPKQKQKYWQPPGSSDPGPYYPQVDGIDWAAVLADAAQPLFVVEGEVKAIISSSYLTGMPILAIGGVWMWRNLLTQPDVVWRGRTVVICFDHDEGQSPGEYKPQVKLALSKFCSELAMLGANVKVVHLGLLPGVNPAEKCGLDDYFRGGGKPGLVLDNLSEPPTGCEMLAEMFERYVVLKLSKPSVWDSVTEEMYSFVSFREICANKWRLDETSNGRKTKVYVGVEFLERHDRPEVSKVIFDPRLPKGVADDALNLWEPWPELKGKVIERHVKAMGRLVEVICGEFHKEIACWIAHMLRKPWERTIQAVVIYTKLEGIGKSLLGEIIGRLVGQRHYAESSVAELSSAYNDHLDTAVWMLVNELDSKYVVSESWMKNLLSQETVRVERKHGSVYHIPNLRRFMFNSNVESSMRLSSQNRRVWAVSPILTLESSETWKKWLKSEIADPYDHGNGADFLASAMEFFNRVDISNYDPMADVINGEAARDLMENSRTAIQVAADSLCEDIRNSNKPFVLTPEAAKMESEVLKLVWGTLRAEGWGKGRKTVRGKGNFVIISLVDHFVKDANYISHYEGPASVAELEQLASSWGTILMKAVAHLKR